MRLERVRAARRQHPHILRPGVIRVVDRTRDAVRADPIAIGADERHREVRVGAARLQRRGDRQVRRRVVAGTTHRGQADRPRRQEVVAVAVGSDMLAVAGVKRSDMSSDFPAKSSDNYSYSERLAENTYSVNQT